MAVFDVSLSLSLSLSLSRARARVVSMKDGISGVTEWQLIRARFTDYTLIPSI